MGAGLALLLYAAVVSVVAPTVLVSSTRRGVAPRLGVAAWSIAIASVVIAWPTGVGLLLVDVVHLWAVPDRSLVGSCVRVLQSILGAEPARVVPVVALGTAAVAALVWVVRLVRGITVACRRSRAYARHTGLVARRGAGLDAVVLDSPERMAYCVAGRPDVIVVTTSALNALGPRELDAVLAHERAHLAGRHHHLLAAVRVLADISPRRRLFTVGAGDIARLLEMCADDAASRVHGPGALLRGLIALAGGGTTPGLAASAVAVLERAGRLAASTASGGGSNGLHRAAAITGVAALVVSPVSAVVAGVLWCPPLTW